MKLLADCLSEEAILEESAMSVARLIEASSDATQDRLENA